MRYYLIGSVGKSKVSKNLVYNFDNMTENGYPSFKEINNFISAAHPMQTTIQVVSISELSQTDLQDFLSETGTN